MSSEMLSEMIRNAVHKLKIQKQPKFYKCVIKNKPLFLKLLKAGKMKQIRPGLWEYIG